MTTKDPEDSELITRFLAGDQSAWESLVQRYRRLVYSIPIRMGIGEHDADDIFQETFLTLYRKISTLRQRDRIGVWLAVTARRKALDRVTRGPATREIALDAGYDHEDSETELADDELVRIERETRVRTAVESLSGQCRLLFEGLFYEDPPLKYRDLAKRMKMSQGSLGPTRSRCFEKLRTALASLGWP